MTILGLAIIVLISLNAMRTNAFAVPRGVLWLGILITVAPHTPWPAQILVSHLQRPFTSGAPVVWAASNVIIVLGAGVETPTTERIEANVLSRSRTLAAAVAYHACRLESSDCVVIASGGDPRNAGATEASRIETLLIQLGIPQIDIKTESASRNTFTNAQHSSELVRESYPNRNIFLVTSSLHMKRSLLYFMHFGVSATPIISDWVSPKSGLKAMTYNALLTDMALAEYVGIGRYYVYSWLGWNPPLRSPSEIL